MLSTFLLGLFLVPAASANAVDHEGNIFLDIYQSHLKRKNISIRSII